MVIVKITSGLGNQLFQYAFGRAISLKYKRELYLDLSSFKSNTERNYLLNNFNIKAKILSDGNNLEFKSFFNSKNLIYHKERKKSYYEIILRESCDYYFEGYWQSIKYFEFQETAIRKDCSLKKNNFPETYLSVHVRRGDYLNNPKIKKKFITCCIDYYLKSISTFDSNCSFSIFSDDYEYCISNFSNFSNANIIEPDTSDPLFDFARMINSKNLIISNSTFSWWAAWLNPFKDKIIIAPKVWYKKRNMQSRVEGLLLKGWIIKDNLC